MVYVPLGPPAEVSLEHNRSLPTPFHLVVIVVTGVVTGGRGRGKSRGRVRDRNTVGNMVVFGIRVRRINRV